MDYYNVRLLFSYIKYCVIFSELCSTSYANELIHVAYILHIQRSKINPDK